MKRVILVGPNLKAFQQDFFHFHGSFQIVTTTRWIKQVVVLTFLLLNQQQHFISQRIQLENLNALRFSQSQISMQKYSKIKPNLALSSLSAGLQDKDKR